MVNISKDQSLHQISYYIPGTKVVSAGGQFYEVVRQIPGEKTAIIRSLVSGNEVECTYHESSLFAEIDKLPEVEKERLRRYFKNEQENYNKFVKRNNQ